MYYSLLSDRAVLAIFGDDAATFLQGLISNDIRKVSAETAIFSALLSPQGKFLYDFFIIQQEGTYLLETESSRLPDLVKRLLMYRLRSKVEIVPIEGMKVAALWGGELEKWNLESGIYGDPRLPELGKRIIYNENNRPAFNGEPGDYDRHRLLLAIPDGSKDVIIDRSLLLEFGYDELHGVDFTKGCYVGQEVTARSKHRATLRKFIHYVKGDKILPPPGTLIMAGGREVGEIRSSSGEVGLALLRSEEVKRAEENAIPLMCYDVMLTATLPKWCTTSFESEK
jgi:folate-binding protein YgfZ